MSNATTVLRKISIPMNTTIATKRINWMNEIALLFGEGRKKL